VTEDDPHPGLLPPEGAIERLAGVECSTGKVPLPGIDGVVGGAFQEEDPPGAVPDECRNGEVERFFRRMET
jgi:hypothetical protein